MNVWELCEAIGDADSAWVQQAHGAAPGRCRAAARWVAAAACAAVLAVAAVPLINRSRQPAQPAETTFALPPISQMQSPVSQTQSPSLPPVTAQENVLALNPVEMPLLSGDMDVQIQGYNGPGEALWDQAGTDFRAFTQVELEAFLGKIPETWRCAGAYSLSVPEGRDTGVYSLHDFVFRLEGEGESWASVAVSPLEAPVRDYIVWCEDPQVSRICGQELVIYASGDAYLTNFARDGFYYDVETRNVSPEVLEALLAGLMQE